MLKDLGVKSWDFMVALLLSLLLSFLHSLLVLLYLLLLSNSIIIALKIIKVQRQGV